MVPCSHGQRTASHVPLKQNKLQNLHKNTQHIFNTTSRPVARRPVARRTKKTVMCRNRHLLFIRGLNLKAEGFISFLPFFQAQFSNCIIKSVQHFCHLAGISWTCVQMCAIRHFVGAESTIGQVEDAPHFEAGTLLPGPCCIREVAHS